MNISKSIVTHWGKIFENQELARSGKLVLEAEDDDFPWDDGSKKPEPSYDDVLTIAKNEDNPDDVMSREEYDELSDAEKEEIRDSALLSFSDQDKQDIADWEEKQKKVKDGENAVRLYVCEKVTDFTKDEVGEEVHVNIGNVTFKTREEAMEELERRKKEMVETFKIPAEKFRDISKDFIPIAIRREDPEAYGVIYNEFEGEGEITRKQGGTMTKADIAAGKERPTYTVGFEKNTRWVFAEYFIYASKSIMSKKDANKLVQSLEKTASDDYEYDEED